MKLWFVRYEKIKTEDLGINIKRKFDDLINIIKFSKMVKLKEAQEAQSLFSDTYLYTSYMVPKQWGKYILISVNKDIFSKYFHIILLFI